jgi:hypothetical protein
MRGTVLSAREGSGGDGGQSKVADTIVKLDRTVFVVSLSVRLPSGTLRLDMLFWQRIWRKFDSRKRVLYYDADR